MRVPYTITSNSNSGFRSALRRDLGIHNHVQTGAGLGGFLMKMFKQVLPIGKTILREGFKIAKPGLQDVGQQLVGSAANYATQQLASGVDKLTNKIGGKRKQDALS